MVKKLIVLLCVSMSFFSCSENHEATSVTAGHNTELGNDVAVQTIIDFYKWYRDRPSIQHCLVSNACNETFDSTKFYAVDFKATEKYLEILKKSGYISDQYISYWRGYFKKCDENFKNNPVSEGVPEGFDYDFVTNSQDFEEELNTIEKAKAVKVADLNGKKTITMKFTTGNTLTYELSNINGRWYIDMIK